MDVDITELRQRFFFRRERSRSAHAFHRTIIRELLVNQNKPIHAVKAFVGHVDLTTTMGYVEVGLEDQRTAFGEARKDEGTKDPKADTIALLNLMLKRGDIDPDTYAKAISYL